MRAGSPRAQTSTVVAIASGKRLPEVHETLDALAQTLGVRPIVITLGGNEGPGLSDRHGTTVIQGLVPRYLNNAVASLRLSSLPALAWWREPSADGLPELAELVDRLVLDVEDPTELWGLVPEVAARTAVSDVRWARLTRWRDLIAQFFDLPDVRAAAESFSHLEIAGGDPHSARLAAGWITSRLPAKGIDVALQGNGQPAAIRSIRLSSDAIVLSLRLMPNDACIETVVDLPAMPPASRIVSAGDGRLLAVMGEELRVRSRDLAFEAAVAAAGGIR